MAVLATARVGTKNRVYLPPEVVEALGVREGDLILFRREDGRVRVERLR